MRKRGPQAQLETELRATNVVGNYLGSIVCTEQGLLVASDGNIPSDEALAGFASLFDEIVARGGRDLALGDIDEVTVLDRHAGRLVIRPLTSTSDGGNAAFRSDQPRMFLVIWMPADATWRRNMNRLVARLRELLDPLLAAAAAAHATGD